MKYQRPIRRNCSNSEFFRACLGESTIVTDALARAKGNLIHQYSQNVEGDQRSLALALNEAEALAWDTGYPHLVFPLLGEEKARATAAWHSRQQTLKREFAFAE